jgi:predicted transcriptional regulator of viral defense system
MKHPKMDMGITMPKITKNQTARGRPSKADDHLHRLRRLGLFNASQAKKSGVPQQTLSRLVAAGQILRLTRDLYRHPETEIDPATEDFSIACAKFGPQSAIGGLTALYHYHLTDQAPQQIWILVPPNRTTNDSQYRCMRVKAKFGTGVETHETYRVVSIERAVAEGLRFATKIGTETAIRAARNAFKQKLTTSAKVLKMARELKIERFVMKHWEAITVE